MGQRVEETELPSMPTTVGPDDSSLDPEKPSKKAAKEKKPAEPQVPFSQLFRFADKWDALLMIVGLVAALAHGCLMPAFSLIFGELVDAFNLSAGQLYAEISRICVYFVYVGIGGIVVASLQFGTWATSAERQMKRCRTEYVRAVLKQDITWFDKTDSGAMAARISGDTTMYHEAISDKMATFMQYMGTFLAGFILGFVRGWQLTLVILAITPLLAIAGAMMMKIMGDLTTKSNTAYASAGSVANEALLGIRTVASFGAEQRELARYSDRLEPALRFGYRKGISVGGSLGLLMLIMFGSYGLALWYGVQLIIDGLYTGGDVLTVFFSVIIGAFALGQAGPSMEALGKGRGAAAKIFEIIDRKSEIDPTSTEGRTLENVRGTVEIRNVSFRYPTRPDTQVFKDYTLTIEPGKKVALVGQSGCGKSSTVSLLQRFYDPLEGEVLIDGVNIKELNIKWMRSQIGLVGQEPVLFQGTIADNISYGKPGASREEIIAAAQAANAHRFIMKFPAQYDTPVGEKGAQLSGGQKQRIAIARAIIKDPRILLLDEATSALDTESEAIVQDALNRVMKGRTTIVIAHRLATVRDADVIAVIDKGHVAEQGNHDELMARGGIYSKLVQAQLGGQSGKATKSAQSKTELKSQAQLAIPSDVDEEVIMQQDRSESEEEAGCCAKQKKKKDEEEEYPVSMGRIFQYNKPEVPFMLIGAIGAIINAAINPAFALVFSEMVTLFYEPDDQKRADVAKWAWLFFGIGASSLLANLLQSGCYGISGERLTHRLRKLVFKAMLRQDVAWFDDAKHSTGVLTAHLAADAALIEGLMGTRIGLTLQNILVIIASLIVAFIYNWRLTLVVLAASPAMAFGELMNGLLFKGFASKGQSELAKANSLATEAITNIRTVASFTSEERVVAMYAQKLAKPKAMNIRSGQANGFLVGLGEAMLFCTYALGFWYGGVLIRDGVSTFGDVIKVFMAIAMMAMSIGQTAAFGPNTTKAKAAAGHLFRIVDRLPPIDTESDHGQKPADVSGDIEFKEVAFTYPTRSTAPVFESVSFKVEAGQVCALVGQSGSGKSTCVSLLERFYETTKGQILLDGNDIKDLNLGWLRQQMALVGQEPVLFQGSIRDNILYGKPDATQEEIEKAAREANAYEFIDSFPDKFDTQVGEKGVKLSGGQKQRIAIARAIVRNPRILLLDEATSALDTESEKVVQRALDNVMSGRTTIVIAHRLSTIRNADVIFMIDSGKVAEQGTHDELMKLQGLYYNLVSRQTDMSVLDDDHQ